MINFEFRWGQLLAGDPATDTEWSWEKGDSFITWMIEGVDQPEIWIPEGAGVTQVKAIIRRHAKGDVVWE